VASFVDAGVEPDATVAELTLQEAAARYGVELNLLSGRVTDLTAVITQVEKSKLDGMITVGTDFDVRP
jgi:hypothetical protein